MFKLPKLLLENTFKIAHENETWSFWGTKDAPENMKILGKYSSFHPNAIRGNIFEHEGKNYLMIVHCAYHGPYDKVLLEKIILKLEAETSKKIDLIVDDHGYEIERGPQ
jgi:hypothetical protein